MIALLKTKQLWTHSIMCLFALFIMLAPELASAGGGGVGGDSGVIGGVLCRVVGWFTGTVGKGIATLAIIVIGIGALMGKVSWGMAIIVGVGVAVVFGAPTLVNEIAGNSYSC
jgi:type IV secretory pathway VirB2 component (pilin)